MSMDDFADLGLMQLADSFFPSGLYTMSNGLESLYLQKRITSPEQVRNFIEMYFLQQIGPADCVALANAYDFVENNDTNALFAVDESIYKIKLIKEQRDASVRSGRQLVKCLASFRNDDLLDKYLQAILSSKTPGTYPVSIAIAAKLFGIPKQKAALTLFYGFAVSVIGAALRLGILQHFEGQKILNELKPTISETVQKYIKVSYDQMWQFAPQLDIIQIHHEKMDSKMFIT
ncbi:MAG TPA: urease accessory UreF family protein [Nitrosopumilaceae archaeon]|nr:urease accessory UreF family protein [Nitrosopumilaceae archaeon]